MIRHWAYAVGAASLLAMLLAGCASGAAKGGPLASKVGGQLLECIPSSPDGLYTDGMTSLPNLSTNTAVIERITLIDAHNLRILSSWIVPAAGPVYGDIPGGYPPRSGRPPAPSRLRLGGTSEGDRRHDPAYPQRRSGRHPPERQPGHSHGRATARPRVRPGHVRLVPTRRSPVPAPHHDLAVAEAREHQGLPEGVARPP